MKFHSVLSFSRAAVVALCCLPFLVGGCVHSPDVKQQQQRDESLEWRMVSLEANFLDFKEKTRDQDQRIKAIEARLNSGVALPVPGEETIIEEETFVQPGQEKDQAYNPPPAKPAKAKPTAASLYDKGMQDYKAGRSQAARENFNAFIAANPNDKLLPNALYWVGETYYDQNNFAQAILSFKEVTRRFPKSSKAPDSLLKIGFSYEKLKDVNNAKFYLKALVDEYPKSGPANMARDKLKTLGG